MTERGNKILRIILIILMILILLTAVGRYLYLHLAQSKIAEGWINKIEGPGDATTRTKGIKLPEGVKASIHSNLAKLGWKDTNTMIKFSKKMEAQDYLGAIGMKAEVWPILTQKTDLAKIPELIGTIIPG